MDKIRRCFQFITARICILDQQRKRKRNVTDVMDSRSSFPPHDETETMSSVAPAHTPTESHQVPGVAEAEDYIPPHVWDALKPSDRFASTADLCACLGGRLPLQVVKLIARDVLRGLCGLGHAHGDINPCTILLSPTDFRALVSQLQADTQSSLSHAELTVGISFGRESQGASLPDTTAPIFILADRESEGQPPRHHYPDCQALQAPETLLGVPNSEKTIPADMWALGCILVELLTGESLFDPTFRAIESNLSEEESHLIQMIEVFGKIPLDTIKAGRLSHHWFTADGAFRIDTEYYPNSLSSVLAQNLLETEVLETNDFLHKLLQLCPQDRPLPDNVIDDIWFGNY